MRLNHINKIVIFGQVHSLFQLWSTTTYYNELGTLFESVTLLYSSMLFLSGYHDSSHIHPLKYLLEPIQHDLVIYVQKLRSHFSRYSGCDYYLLGIICTVHHVGSEQTTNSCRRWLTHLTQHKANHSYQTLYIQKNIG